MRVSEYFNLGKTQPYLDFVDIRLETDIPVFIDPVALKSLETDWGLECSYLLQNFFETVLGEIKAEQNQKALILLSALNERNEFHLGYSSGKSRGHAFGAISAETVWGALSKSQASTTGLLKDLEDTALVIEGIGRDMISDAVCNIIRGPLIQYTQEICRYYGIPLTSGLDSGPVWNPSNKRWEHSFTSLPMTNEGPVLLVPKVIVRHKISYQYDEYYTHYLLPEMQSHELGANTGLVELLKNGRRRVTKKSLREKYGDNKLAVVEQTIRFPHVLDEYRSDKHAHVPPPLNHYQISEIQETAPPDWQGLLEQLETIPVGREHATAYENLIEEILSALLYPSLSNPRKQDELHNGRKRIDITYQNTARDGFFQWLSNNYPAGHIAVECKNYGKEVGNPEIDQLSGRFSPSRGQIGILVCRSVENAARLQQRCIDTANDVRGYIIPLTDADIVTLVQELQLTDLPSDYPLLMSKFRRLLNMGQ